MGRKTTLFNRLTSSIAVVIVLALSLGLLTYVGYGEARRTYPKFELEKLEAQGELVKKSVETFLLASLPLEQFPGFSTLSDPILNSDRTIAAIYISDTKKRLIFSNFQDDHEYNLGTIQFSPSSLQEKDSLYTMSESLSFFRVSLQLHSKTEQVGELHLLIPRAIINDKINSLFFYVLMAAIALLVVYAIFVFVQGRRWNGESTRWLSISYGIAFVLMSSVVVVTLVILYTDGIEAKTRALGNSLTQRLNAPLELGLQINDFDRLDQTFKDYQKLNPDLSSVSLTIDNKVAIDTNPAKIGSDWRTNPDQFEYRAELTRGSDAKGVAVVLVGIPRSVIYDKLWRSVKNFFVLFIASLLLTTLFFNLIRAFSNYRSSERSTTTRQIFQLSLVGPLYFLGIFADSLTNSFLPQHFQQLASKDGVDSGLVSTLFTVFFICYAVALVPAGRFAENNVKPLFLIGTLLLSSELLMLAFVQNFYAMFAVEIMAGLGHGMFFIGVQSYILHVASSKQRTQAAGLIVFGYNGGVLAGTAIGALLAADPALGQKGVFITGSVLALLVFFYAVGLMPRHSALARIAEGPAARPIDVKEGFWSSLFKATKDLRFIKAVLLIAIPTKIVLTGLIVASLPLVLTNQNYQTEDIGQIIMFYSGGVLISSRFMSRLADKTGKTTSLLFFGTLGGGLGLILIGAMSWHSSSWPLLSTIALIAGLAILGVAHGCIQAPLVTYVADTPTAARLGKASATSLYRLLERAGNISGPIIVSQVLFLNSQDPFAISWMGMALLVFGLLFVIGFKRSPKPSEVPAKLEESLEVSTSPH